MITIKPTKAGKEYLNDQTGQAERTIMILRGGNDDKNVAKLIKSAIKLLSKAEEKGTIETDSVEELNFLIINKLAQIVQAPQEAVNQLSDIHKPIKEPIEAINREPNQNSLAEIHISKDEQLGETPDVLPTHLGGIELEKEN